MRITFLLIATILLIITGLPQTQKFNDFELFMNEINKLEESENYDGALSLLQNSESFYPDDYYDISKEKIYLNEKLENFEANKDVWSRGHELGYFYGIFPQMPKYKKYNDFSWFEEIISRDAKLRNEFMSKLSIAYEIVKPNNYNRQQYYPVIFIFHGGGKSKEHAKRYWNSKILDSSYIKVFLQSNLVLGFNEYGWGRVEENMLDQINECIMKVLINHKIDNKRIYFGGISAGVLPALRSAIAARINGSKIIAVCPAFSKETLSIDEITELNRLNLNTFFILGEKDRLINRQLELSQFLSLNNLRIDLIKLGNSGHEYPGNFGEILDRKIIE